MSGCSHVLQMLLPSSGSSELGDSCGNLSLEHAGVESSDVESINHRGKSLTVPSLADVMEFALSSGRSLMWSPVG